MQTNHDAPGSLASSAGVAIHTRSPLRALFLLMLGIVYPAFMAVIFLKPELPEYLFREASGHVISGLALGLLIFCFVLATACFRAADRQYRERTSNPTTACSSGGTPQPDHEP